MKRFLLAVRLIVAGLALVQAVPAHAAELVVSANDLSVQVSGPWQTGSTSDAGSYLFRPAGAGSATVFWPFPASLGTGQYQVFANWVSGPDRANNATYFVASGDGTQTVTENQQQNGGNWASLGTFTFDPGKGQGVTLNDSGSGIVVAGSVRWLSPTDGSSAAVAAAPVAAAASATPGASATAGASTTPAASATAGASPTAAASPAASATPAPSATPTSPSDGPSSDPNAVWTVAMKATDLHGARGCELQLLNDVF